MDCRNQWIKGKRFFLFCWIWQFWCLHLYIVHIFSFLKMMKLRIASFFFQQNLPPSAVSCVGGKIFTFGSYRLGVHTKGMGSWSCVWGCTRMSFGPVWVQLEQVCAWALAGHTRPPTRYIRNTWHCGGVRPFFWHRRNRPIASALWVMAVSWLGHL